MHCEELFENCTRIIEVRFPVINELSEFNMSIPDLRSKVYKTLLEKGIAKKKIDITFCEMITMLTNHFMFRGMYEEDYFRRVENKM